MAVAAGFDDADGRGRVVDGAADCNGGKTHCLSFVVGCRTGGGQRGVTVGWLE